MAENIPGLVLLLISQPYSFSVSNGVKQDGVLSPVLFTIYIDKLLLELRQQGVGCYWNSHFTGA